MAGRTGWRLEARAVASATHQSGMGRRMPKGMGVTTAAAKMRTQKAKFRNSTRRGRRGR